MNADSKIQTRIVIVSGSPGTGKTTISRKLAENSRYDNAVHIEVDDFWQYIRKGYIHPWLDGSGDQNEAVVDAVAASAAVYAQNGYEVFVAGTVGPWFLSPWLEIARSGIDVRYIVLRPDQSTTVIRSTERQQRERFPLKIEIIKDVWNSFTGLGEYESHVLDTTGQTTDESVAVIQSMVLAGAFRVVGKIAGGQ